MLLGFALTQHCNLRCPHCIRDDVETMRVLPPSLVERVVEEARELFGPLTVSFTGGEPTLHPDWERLIAFLSEAGIPYRFVSNGWNLRRLMPALDRHPPGAVRLSLSGATEAVHDAERGRGSFRRVLMGVALLTSRRIPTSLSIVVDRRDRHQVREAADLAESLGCVDLHYILPQPVVGSVARDSDLPPAEWYDVRREVEVLMREPGRRTRILLDYGYPFDGPERICNNFLLRRLTVDARGRVALCCQLSEYGFNEADVVADLNEQSLRDVWPEYVRRLMDLQTASRPDPDAADPFDDFPCLRCARACGKMEWIRRFPESPWTGAAGQAVPVPVPLEASLWTE